MRRYAWTLVFSCLAHLTLLVLFAGGRPGVRAEERIVQIEMALAGAGVPAQETVAAERSPAGPATRRPVSLRPLATNVVRPDAPEDVLPPSSGDPGPMTTPEIGPVKLADPPAAAAGETPTGQIPTSVGGSPPSGQASSGSASAIASGEPVPAASGPVYQPPVLYHDVPPIYPAEARFQGWEGRVVLEFVVSADGRVTQVRVAVSSEHDLLDQAAVAAALQWRYLPASLDGQAVEVRLRRAIRFKLT